MAHWQHRDEPGWQKFEFNQPYAKGLKRLKEKVLAKTDFDPATLSAIALAQSGNTLLVGGQFVTIAGQSRFGIAAFDATTGNASGWTAHAGDHISALATSGNEVFIGGEIITNGSSATARAGASSRPRTRTSSSVASRRSSAF